MGGSSSSSRSRSNSESYSNSYRHTRSIQWTKYGNTWVTNVSGRLTGDVIQEILWDFGGSLGYYERQLFIEARREITREWGHFLKNATVIVYTDDRTYVIKCGDGTNKLTVQTDRYGNVTTDWSGGFWRPVKNICMGIGSFLTRLVRPAAAIMSGGLLGIGWI